MTDHHISIGIKSQCAVKGVQFSPLAAWVGGGGGAWGMNSAEILFQSFCRRPLVSHSGKGSNWFVYLSRLNCWKRRGVNRPVAITRGSQFDQVTLTIWLSSKNCMICSQKLLTENFEVEYRSAGGDSGGRRLGLVMWGLTFCCCCWGRYLKNWSECKLYPPHYFT